jgi:protein-disulfide isomerase
MQNKKIVLIVSIALLILFFVTGYVYKNNQTEEYVKMSKEQALLFQRPHSFVVGDENAKVQLVEFFDPACETCAQFHPLIKRIMKEHDGKIKLVLRYAPFHQNSDYAVMMLEAAREQNLFMETLEFMFDTQDYWVKHHVVDAKELWYLLNNIEGLDMEKMAQFINSKKANTVIEQDLNDAKTVTSIWV